MHHASITGVWADTSGGKNVQCFHPKHDILSNDVNFAPSTLYTTKKKKKKKVNACQVNSYKWLRRDRLIPATVSLNYPEDKDLKNNLT